MKFNFDGQNYLARIITGIVEVDSQIDLYSDWKEWVSSGSGAGIYPMFRSFGGDPLGGGKIAGDYYIFQNQEVITGVDGWRIRPWCGNYELIVNGNLYTEDPSVPLFSMPAGTCNVMIALERSVLAQSVTASGITASVSQEDKDDIVTMVWDEPLTAATHNVPTSSGRRLRTLGDTIPGTVVDPSPTTTGFITDLTSPYTDFYSNQYIRFVDGNLEGQVRIATKFNPANKRLCICGAEPFSVAPANGDEFDLVPVHIHPVKELAFFTWEELMDAHMTPTTFGYMQELIRQLREGNIYYEFIKATSQNATRKVDSGVVDYIVTKHKPDASPDWTGSGVITKNLYLWYETIGDTDPIYVKESD